MMWSGVLRVVCLCWTLLPLTTAHICIITPRQRGPMDISKGGSNTCTRHQYPCGGQAEQKRPFQQLKGGVSVFIKWQQNLNHYSIGNPGYMDVSFAVANEVSNVTVHPGLSEDPFRLLSIVEDRHEYAQDHQRNYTAVIQFPNMDCDHCVIRTRYEARKPGETTFYQCADVSIKMTSPQERHEMKGQIQLLSETARDSNNTDNDASVPGIERLQNALDLTKTAPTETGSTRIYGMTNEIEPSRGANLVAIDDVTGSISEVASLSFRVDSPFYQRGRLPNTTVDFVTDSVLTLDGARNVLVMPMNRHNSMDALADTVIEVDTRSGYVTSRYNVTYNHADMSSALTSGFSAAIVEIESSYITFNLVEDKKQHGKFHFVVGRLLVGGQWQMLTKSDKTESDYVNFLWADYDISVKTLYVLLGNEGDPDGQTARLYKFLVMPGPPPPSPSTDSYSFVQLDVSKFPFMAFHLHPYHSNLLFAVSPGLYGVKYPSYHLVTVDVDFGTVKEVMEIAPAGIFESFYGGAVINGFNPMVNRLIHVLRIADTNADVIATIDPFANKTSFSQVTNLRHVYSLYVGL